MRSAVSMRAEIKINFVLMFMGIGAFLIEATTNHAWTEAVGLLCISAQIGLGFIVWLDDAAEKKAREENS